MQYANIELCHGEGVKRVGLEAYLIFLCVRCHFIPWNCLDM